MAVSLEQFATQIVNARLISDAEIQTLIDGMFERGQSDCMQLVRELVRLQKLTAYQAQAVYLGQVKSLRLGNYLVLDKLGQGGMGMVLKAEHRRMKRLVALKVLSPFVTKSEDSLKRFQREVEAAAKLQHPNIVTAYDADEVNGTHFLVMEYIDGIDLSALVKRDGPQSVERSVAWIIQAARGLEFAHQHGVIHRDIKPSNLLVDANGTLKILDMGLARIESKTETQPELTSTGVVVGTAEYMSPEQAMSNAKSDGRSDIYSLGITLWYLLTAKGAYDGETLMAKLLAHREAPIPSLCCVRPDVPAAVDAVFQKMVAKQANDRQQRMTEVIRDLECCQIGPPSSINVDIRRPQSVEFHAFLNEFETPSDATEGSAIPNEDSTARTATFYADDARNTLLRAADAQTQSLSGSTGRRKERAALPWWRDSSLQITSGVTAVAILIGIAFALRNPGEKAQVAGAKSASNENSETSNRPSKSPTGIKSNLRAMINLPIDVQPANEAVHGSVIQDVPVKQRAIDLLPLVDLKQELLRGRWESKTGQFHSAGKNLNNLLRLPVETGDNYTIQVRFSIERTNFSIILPVGDSGTEYGIVGGAGALKLGGMEWRTALRGQAIPMRVDDGQFHTLTIQITTSPNDQVGVSTWIDGHPVTNWQGTRSELKYPRFLDSHDNCLLVNAFPTADVPARVDEAVLFLSHDQSKFLRPVATVDTPQLAKAPFDARQARVHQEAWARHLGTTVETTNSVGAKMVLIPPGEFLMGYTDADHAELAKTTQEGIRFPTIFTNERPQHCVRITQPFAAGRFEVTRSEFKQFVDNTKYVTEAERTKLPAEGMPAVPTWNSAPSSFFSDQHPITCISWKDARSFCDWLSAKEGQRYSLPTEAQFEFMCRAGTQDIWAGPEATLSERAWLGGASPSEVGLKTPNSFGLCDIQGNVGEWTRDGFAEYAADAEEDPLIPWTGPYLVIRGGSFRFPPHHCRPGKRGWVVPGTSNEYLGFRVVRTIELPKPTKD